jgi:hypothetical protein
MTGEKFHTDLVGEAVQYTTPDGKKTVQGVVRVVHNEGGILYATVQLISEAAPLRKYQVGQLTVLPQRR